MRIAWCCQWIPPSGEDATAAEALNFRGTTATAIAKLTPAEATARLLAITRHNLAALQAQIAYAAQRPPLERAMRIGSNLLPVFTHPAARPRYDEPVLRETIERGLDAAGRLARNGGVRLSMHPGQFTVLATANPNALRGTIDEIEHHAMILRGLGLAGTWHPDGAHINVHGGAREPGVETFRANFARLSEDARNLLTVENDELAYGLDDLLKLADALPIVLDIHHHWIHSQGEHIRPDDPRIDRIAASWRGTRPMAHLSAPARAVMPDWPADALPDYARLIASGITARDLRAHSDTVWNGAILDWAAEHLAWTDLEIEAKHKNIASAAFAAALGDPPRVPQRPRRY